MTTRIEANISASPFSTRYLQLLPNIAKSLQHINLATAINKTKSTSSEIAQTSLKFFLIINNCTCMGRGYPITTTTFLIKQRVPPTQHSATVKFFSTSRSPRRSRSPVSRSRSRDRRSRSDSRDRR